MSRLGDYLDQMLTAANDALGFVEARHLLRSLWRYSWGADNCVRAHNVLRNH